MTSNSSLEVAAGKTKIAWNHLLGHPYWEPNCKEYAISPDFFHKLAIVALHYLWKNDPIGYQRAVGVLHIYFSLPPASIAAKTFPYTDGLYGLLKQVEQDILYTEEDIEKLTKQYYTFIATNFTCLFYDPLSLQILAQIKQGGREKQYDDFFIREYNDGVLAAVLDGIGKNPLSRIIVDRILLALRNIQQLSVHAVQEALQVVQKEIVEEKKLNKNDGGSTLVLFIYLNSGEVYSITIGDSWYITVDDKGLHRSTPHSIKGSITEAIGARRTSNRPIRSFTKRHQAIPENTILASDGFSDIERFSPKIVHTLLRDTAIPPVLKMAMIGMLSGLVMGMNADNGTFILITRGIDDESTEQLIR